MESQYALEQILLNVFLIGDHLWAYHTIKVDTFEYITFVVVVVDMIECVDSGFQFCFVNGLEENTM